MGGATHHGPVNIQLYVRCCLLLIVDMQITHSLIRRNFATVSTASRVVSNKMFRNYLAM